jgi:hypothetical protein
MHAFSTRMIYAIFSFSIFSNLPIHKESTRTHVHQKSTSQLLVTNLRQQIRIYNLSQIDKEIVQLFF